MESFDLGKSAACYFSKKDFARSVTIRVELYGLLQALIWAVLEQSRLDALILAALSQRCNGDIGGIVGKHRE
jgi:hypothetical protein